MMPPLPCLVMLAVAPGLLIYARLHDKAGFLRWWVNAWVVVSYGLEWARYRLWPWLHAGLVLVAWWARAVIAQRLPARRRAIRQEMR